MALESLVASVWRLEGFLTVVRHPVRVPYGFSDIDVVGVRADGNVRIAECKMGGPARQIHVIGDDAILPPNWTKSLDNVDRLWATRPDWLPRVPDVYGIEFHLVGNVWFLDEHAHQEAEAQLTKDLKAHLPHGHKRKGRAVIFPSVTILLTAISKIKTDVVDRRWGKRYGDPLLDTLRDLIRYAHPKPKGAKNVRDEICEEIRYLLEEAIFD